MSHHEPAGSAPPRLRHPAEPPVLAVMVILDAANVPVVVRAAGVVPFLPGAGSR